MFFDLNLPYTQEQNVLPTLIELIELGYDGVAINQMFHVPANANKPNQVPIPINLEKIKSKLNATKYKNKTNNCPLAIYRRITYTVDKDLPSSYIKKARELGYDIVCINPQTESALKACCKVSHLDFDMISLNLNERLPYLTKGNLIKTASEKKVLFEIQYSSMYLDSTSRRNTITNATALGKLCKKSKNGGVILSSGTNDTFLLRNPYDIATLSVLFDLKIEIGKLALSDNCHNVIKNVEN